MLNYTMSEYDCVYEAAKYAMVIAWTGLASLLCYHFSKPVRDFFTPIIFLNGAEKKDLSSTDLEGLTIDKVL